MKPKIRVVNRREYSTARLVYCFVMLSILFIFSYYSAPAAAAKATLYDVDYRVDPALQDVAETINIGCETASLPTTISEWERDLGPSMVNGTYWGTYFTGSKFHNFYKPIWSETYNTFPEWNNDTALKSGRYSYVLISTYFNWSGEILMSGTSEWWIRPPISPQSIEVKHGLVMGIFKNMGKNASLVYLEPSFDSSPYYDTDVPGYGGCLTTPLMRPSIEGYAPNDYIQYNFDGDPGSPVYNPATFDRTSFILGSGKINNDRIYLKVNSILHPNTDYIISLVYRLPRTLGPSEGLFTYWSGMTTHTNWTHWQIYEYVQSINDPISTDYQRWNVDTIGNATLDMPLDMDWSFIFVEGVGAGGLFGKTLAFPSNATLSLYPYFNSSFSANEYMSFMLPFISETNVTVVPEIHQAYYLPLGGYFPAGRQHWWTFFMGLPYFTPSIWYNYSDFILFSSNNTLWFDDSGVTPYFNHDDPWNVRLKLNFLGSPPSLNATRFYNITLLCYERPRPPVLWSSFVDNQTTSWNTSWSPMIHPTVGIYYEKYIPPYRTYFNVLTGEEVDKTHEGERNIDYYVHPGRIITLPSIQEKLYYEVWCSGRSTTGQWAMQTGTVSGMPVYTYHFPQIIFISPMKWKLTSQTAEQLIELSQKDPYYRGAQDWWGEHYFGSALHEKFYIPAARVGPFGYITDSLTWWLGYFMCLGKFIKAFLIEFKGIIITFVQEVGDAITGIIWTLRSLVAPVAMMAIVSIGTKLNNKFLNEA